MTRAVVDMAALTASHFRMPSGVAWRLSAAGVVVGDAPAARTPGQPATVRRVWAWFGSEIRVAALKWGVPVELIVAAMCSESGQSWQTQAQQMAGAYREEPGYLSDDATPGRVSAGCMQTLLSTARSVLARPGLTTDELFEPACSIDAGAGYIAQGVARGSALSTAYDPPLVAAAYNAGGLYLDGSGFNRWHLRCYPLGTGEYIDRFVLWFNDAMSLGVALAGSAPSFARAVRA